MKTRNVMYGLATVGMMVFLFLPASLLGQISGADPLMGNYDIGNSSEVIMVWPETDGDQCNQKIFDFLGSNNIVIPKPLQSETGVNGIGGGMNTAVVSGDFDGDGRDDLIAAWETTDRAIVLSVPEIDDGTLSWTTANTIRSDDNILSAHSPRLIRLLAADLDADARKEVILAYWASDGSIKIQIYDSDESLNFVLKSEIANESLNWDYLGDGSSLFDIAVGNFDYDCFDEIVLIGVSPVMPTHWSLFARIYDINPDTYAITSRARYGSIYEDASRPLYNIRRLAVTAGDLNNDYFEDVAVCFQVWKAESDETYIYIQPFQVNPDLDNIVIDKSKLKLQATYSPGTNNYGYPMDLLACDLNGDGRVELISAAMKKASIFVSDNNFVLTEIEDIDLATQYWDNSRHILAMDDLDATPGDSIWYPEIVIAENRKTLFNCQYRMRVFCPFLDHENGNFIDSVHMRSVWEYNYDDENQRPLTISTGDFDGDGIRLGKPQRYRKTDILQPTVILNAPPIHFDILNNVIYDINGCFLGGGCDFQSVYETEYSEGYEVQTEVHSDWGVDASLSIGGSYMGVSAKAKMTGYYGENFSKISGTSQTITTGVRVTATYDDRIFATTSTYDLWEYPLYSGGELKGYFLVVDPAVIKSEWFGSKSWTADSYVPKHEVGNVLSYPEFADLSDNSDVAEGLKKTDTYGIDATSLYDWWLRFEDFESNDSLKSWNAGMEVGASIGGYGIELEVNGYYDYEEIATHTTTVQNALSLEVYMGSIESSTSEAIYSVTPVAYWAKNGALVVDYSVDVAISGPGGTDTWWKTHYEDFPDPSFILPWKFDPEKGFTLQDETKRWQTNDISFDPVEPDPGDIITIRARVYNFSLINTSGPMSVRFYLGDPDNGGTPLVGTGGETEVTTGNLIPSRSYDSVMMDWQVPLSIENFPRIYAVIDPDSDEDEIQEYNNKGYRVLMVSGGVTDINDDIDILPSDCRLHANYPNPFNATTTIRFSLPSRTAVEMAIYNILGQKVATVAESSYEAGVHQVSWDASAFSSGVYFCRLKTGDYEETRKMLLIK